MAQVTTFTNLDAALDALAIAVQEAETTADGDIQSSATWQQRYVRAKSLARSLARLTLVNSQRGTANPQRIADLVERY